MAERLTDAEFIARARAKHGDTYDYSLARYVTSQRKVTIICPEHGEFQQVPAKHLVGQGCAACGGRARLTTQRFIDRSRRAHGDRYAYSLAEYVNNRTRVTILCPDHGLFHQRPEGHLAGAGCPRCADRERVLARTGTTAEFLAAAAEVHGDRYAYIEVRYVNSGTKVTIVCAEHGPFHQAPNAHLSGRGCPECGFRSISVARAGSLDTFLDRAFTVHGSRFDYARVVFAVRRDQLPSARSVHPAPARTSGRQRMSPVLDVEGGERGRPPPHRTRLDYEHQWRDHDCRDVRRLAFDFALVEHRLLIEFDGAQHSRPVRWGSMAQGEADALFDGVRRRDRIKNGSSNSRPGTRTSTRIPMSTAAAAANTPTVVLPVPVTASTTPRRRPDQVRVPQHPTTPACSWHSTMKNDQVTGSVGFPGGGCRGQGCEAAKRCEPRLREYGPV